VSYSGAQCTAVVPSLIISPQRKHAALYVQLECQETCLGDQDDLSVAWKRKQFSVGSPTFRVNPIKRGVFSATCGVGGLFHDGTAGSRIPDLALAKSGKLSVMRGDTFTLSLFLDMALGRLTSGPKSASTGDQVFRVKT
jgi:hypothetical protein